MAIRLSLAPKVENEANFNLVVHVRKRLAPITVNVKGRGFTMNAELGYQHLPGEPVITLSHKKVRLVRLATCDSEGKLIGEGLD